MSITIPDSLLKRDVDHGVKRNADSEQVRIRETFDYTDCTPEFIMDAVDAELKVRRARPLRGLSQKELEDYAAQGRVVVPAGAAGHKIQSREQIKQDFMTAFVQMTDEEKAEQVKELTARCEAIAKSAKKSTK